MTRIAFLLGSAEISGGTNVIFEHATRLQRHGFAVSVITVSKVESHVYSWHPDAHVLDWITLEEAKRIRFDSVIATWWQSVRLLEELNSQHYVYFVQSIESRFFAERDPEQFSLRDIDILADWCESTYRYPLPVITEARWIQQYLEQHYLRHSHLVLNGIRKDIFNTSGRCIEKRMPGRLRVLIEGPLGVFYKNVEKTIELCLQAEVDEIWLLTSSDIENYPGVNRCFSRVPIAKTAEIYRSCDLLVKLSYVEGMFGPPLEMFHCGGTSLVYEVTGHDEYIRHGVNSVVVQRDRDEEVVVWLRRLKKDRQLLQMLKNGAQETAESWPDWEQSSSAFAASLRKISEESPAARKILIQDFNQYFLSAREKSYSDRAMARFAEREQAVVSGNLQQTNYIQVYWDEGYGITTELVDRYEAGRWERCQVVIPATRSPLTVRLDPSVRIGFVLIKNIKLHEIETNRLLLDLNETTGWHGVTITGTQVCLQQDTNLTLLAYGEDPQCVLPSVNNYTGRSGLRLTVDLCEMSFAEALGHCDNFKKGKKSLKNKVADILSVALRGATNE